MGESSLNGLTQTLPTLYNLPSTDFHDITTGSNGTYSANVRLRPGDRSGHARRQSAGSRPGRISVDAAAERERPVGDFGQRELDAPVCDRASRTLITLADCAGRQQHRHADFEREPTGRWHWVQPAA